jgi:glycerophosphoryl diester phosphodiesterase
MTGPAKDERIGPLVIAHRGACAYLPEHTLAAKALAYGFGADYLEQDVVATRDDELVVLHDIHLDRVSDVVERFPDRARGDGRWYARDFTLADLRTLRVFERMNDDRSGTAFANRFPHRRGRFAIATLADEIEMIRSLNRVTGRNVGIYPEVKRPAWHRAEGIDLAARLLEVLDRYDYRRRGDPVYVQCFDAAETRRIREELGAELRLVQLIGENDWQESPTDFEVLKSDRGIAGVAEYADAIGPWVGQLYTLDETSGHPVAGGLTRRAHDSGLAVHPYTFRADALAPGFDSYSAMVDWFAGTLAVDGLFTDFADLTLAALGRRNPS